MLRYLSIVSLLLFLGACASTNPVSRSATNGNTVKVDGSTAIDLTDYLRRLSGVQVTGSGAGASIVIRGVNSFNSSTEPLFVIDGMIMSGSFSELYNSIDPQQVDQITVLKDAADTAMYGVRGSNGIIVINMRRAIEDQEDGSK